MNIVSVMKKNNKNFTIIPYKTLSKMPTGILMKKMLYLIRGKACLARFFYISLRKRGKIMFQTEDTILYGTHGVCKIQSIEEMTFSGKKQEYYILNPVYNQASTIYVPVHNEALTAKMHRILSAEEIYELIRTMPDEKTIWIENENARKERFQEIISGNNRQELVQLIKTLYLHQEKQKEKGKKLHIADERFLKEAEKLLYNEFALVLDMEPNQVLPFIMGQIEPDKKFE